MIDATHYAIPVFIVSMLIEAFVLSRQDRPYSARDAAASLSGGIGLVVIDLAWKVVALAVMGKIYEHRIADLGALGWAALIVADDFCYYWYHRVSHEIRFFWAGHIAHHSSERYYLATALRQSWTSPMLGLVFWLPLPLLGFQPVNVLLMKSFSLLYQYWIHTETIGTLGPLEWIMNTPSHHRVHHGSNPEYIDRNYAGIFIVWDRLFGTFEPERAKVVYGLTTNIGTYNPVRIQLDEFVAIARDARRARTWGARWHAVFGRTGTHAKGSATRAFEAPVGTLDRV